MENQHAVEHNGLPAVPPIARVPGVEERTITLDGVTWRYLYAGSGPPLLLVHGLMGYSFSWRFTMQTLAQHFSVYAPDLPGCGFSQRLDRLPGSLTSDAEGLLNFMDHLAIEQVDVLGTSRGGGLSIVLAALAAQWKKPSIRKLILSAPINPWSNFGQMRARLLATRIGRLCTIHVLPHLPGLLKRYFIDLYGDPSHIPPDSFEGYRAGLVPEGSFQHLARIMRAWADDLLLVRESLPAIADLPILFLWGARDNAVLPASAKQLRIRLKNSTGLTLDGVGHMPYEELPEDFNRIVIDFLLHNQPRTPMENGSAESAESVVTVEAGDNLPKGSTA